MGNRSYRKQVSTRLKEMGHGHLYKGKQAKHVLNGQDLKYFLFMINLKVGDIVNDCDGFNHVVKTPVAVRPFVGFPASPRSGRVLIQDDQIEFTDGRLSCGCPRGLIPKIPQEDVEKYTLLVLEAAKKEELNDSSLKMLNVLRNREHITDEHGCLLPEFR